MCWGPLASGFLTDGFDVETLDDRDFRRRSRLRERSAEVERLADEARASGRTLRRHAITWVLAQPSVAAAIVGVRSA